MNAHSKTIDNSTKLIHAIDVLAEAEKLVEASLMAAQALEPHETGAMQAVIGQAAKKIEKCKAHLYAIHEGKEGGAACE